MNKRIEYKTKDLENTLTTLKSRIDKETEDNLQRLRLFNASIQQNKEEISKLKIENLESLPDTGENKTTILSAKITANKTRVEKLYSDIETFSVDNENSLTALTSSTRNPRWHHTHDIEFRNNRIINSAHPRNPQDSADYYRDLVTTKFLYDYIKIADSQFLKAIEADRTFLKANEDNILEGRLNMKQHKIIGLADPVNLDDAVTKRYVASRIQALVDEMSEMRRRIARLEILKSSR